MEPFCTPKKRWPHAMRTASFWTRRAALLGSIAVSLALAGQSMTAGAGAAVASRVDSETSVYGAALDRTPIPIVVDRLRGSVGPVSERSVELVSLFVLGLSLIGAGRALARRPVRNPSDKQPARSPERPDSVLRPFVVARRPFRRAAS